MSTQASNVTVGKAGEEFGRDYLKRNGYRILHQNFRSPFGEIDVIAEHDGVLAFIEIKTRKSAAFGAPEEAVDRLKQARLAKIASWYLVRRGRQEPTVRFDILAIHLKDDQPTFRLIQDAFEASFASF